MPTALSAEKPKSGRGCAIVFGLIFFSAGAAFFYFITVRPIFLASTSGSWNETPCTIVSSEVGVHRDSDGDTYSVEISYEYEVNKVRYVGDRYDFMGNFSSSGRSGKQKVVDRYPKGSKQICFVDPDDPESAVLSRDRPAAVWWGLLPAVFMVVGVLVALFVGRSRSSKQQPSYNSALSPDERRFPQSRSVASLGKPQKASGDSPVELKPGTGPKGKFFGVLAIAIFWNGIVSIFVYQLLQGFEWFLAIFLTPFVVVGAGMVGGVFYFGLALFNPRPVVRLSRGSVPLGESAAISWNFVGNTNSVQRLTIKLKAQERATYQRGTNTTTDENTLHEETIVEFYGMDPEIHSGDAEIFIPADAMHSFEALRNEIVWSIELVADIPMWPNVKNSYPFDVRPKRARN